MRGILRPDPGCGRGAMVSNKPLTFTAAVMIDMSPINVFNKNMRTARQDMSLEPPSGGSMPPDRRRSAAPPNTLKLSLAAAPAAAAAGGRRRQSLPSFREAQALVEEDHPQRCWNDVRGAPTSAAYAADSMA